MKRTILNYASIFFSLLFLMSSCSKEFIAPKNAEEINSIETASQGQNPNPSKSLQRRVRYELEGNFSGKLDITFLSSEGFTPPDQIFGVEIPWQTSYDIPNNTPAIGGFINGLYGDANPGENAFLKTFLDDYLIETVIRTANKDGQITLPLESYHLEFDDSQNTISQQNIGREVSYLVDGNFSGEMNLVYRVADGSRQNISLKQGDLPWNYTYETTLNSNKASLYGSGLTGAVGQQVTLSILVDGHELDAATYESKENGEISNPEIFVKFD